MRTPERLRFDQRKAAMRSLTFARTAAGLFSRPVPAASFAQWLQSGIGETAVC
jgi:hypothetical protein